MNNRQQIREWISNNATDLLERFDDGDSNGILGFLPQDELNDRVCNNIFGTDIKVFDPSTCDRYKLYGRHSLTADEYATYKEIRSKAKAFGDYKLTPRQLFLWLDGQEEEITVLEFGSKWYGIILYRLFILS